jgi:hypothetical protein
MHYHSATSVDVARAFSGSRRLLSFTRNRFSAESIRRFMCLGSWCNNNLVKILMKAIVASPMRPTVSEPEEDTEVDGAAD